MNPEIEALESEIARLQEALAAARRHATPETVHNHRLHDLDGSPVELGALFAGRDDLLVVHNMGRRCAYCTMWADGFQSLRPHLESRCAFVVVSADEPAVAAEFARSRGWTFRVVSGAGSEFAHAMGFASERGDPWPGVSAFRRAPAGSIVRTGRARFGPGDAFCSVWHLFDLLGRGVDGWRPALAYP